MTNTVLLNNIDHHDLRIVLGHSAAWGDAINQVLIFPTEYEDIQREYPILFRRDSDGLFQSVALLGLDRDENLFLDESGWQGRYVPAVRQRGPFLIGFRASDPAGEPPEPMIHVDLDHPRVSRDIGEPLFLTHGGNAPYLDHVIRVLGRIHEGLEVSAPMFAAFEEADLIEPIQLQIKLDETTQYNLPDFHTIGPARLARLDGAALERLHRAGFLRAAFMVVASIANVGRIIELKNRKRMAGGNGAPRMAQEVA